MKRLIHKIEFPGPGKHSEHAAVTRYNSYVLEVHNCYSMATMVSRDLRKLAFSVQKSLKSRLRERVKTAKEVKERKYSYEIPDYINEEAYPLSNREQSRHQLHAVGHRRLGQCEPDEAFQHLLRLLQFSKIPLENI